MKISLFIITLLALAITGCQKQQADVSAEPDPAVKAQFEQIRCPIECLFR